MKIHSVGTELFHAGGRTDGDISKSLFEILRTHLRTVRCAVEDDVTFPQSCSSTFCSSQLLVFREVQ